MIAETEANVERVARAMCVAQRLDPDLLVAAGPPASVGNDYFFYPAGLSRPLWSTKIHDARAAILEIAAIEREQ